MKNEQKAKAVAMSRRKLLKGAATIAALGVTNVGCERFTEQAKPAHVDHAVRPQTACDTTGNAENGNPFPALAVWLALVTNGSFVSQCTQSNIEAAFGLTSGSLSYIWQRIGDTTPFTSGTAPQSPNDLYVMVRNDMSLMLANTHPSGGASSMYGGPQCPRSLAPLVKLYNTSWP